MNLIIVNIAAIERQDLNGAPEFANIVFSSVNLGYLFLNGSNALHQKIYQFIELCNFNQSNKDRHKEKMIDTNHTNRRIKRQTNKRIKARHFHRYTPK